MILELFALTWTLLIYIFVGVTGAGWLNLSFDFHKSKVLFTVVFWPAILVFTVFVKSVQWFYQLGKELRSEG